MSANNTNYLNNPGPLTRVYAQAKRDIIAQIDLQERNIFLNRAKLAHDFPLPSKLLAIVRSKENLVLEITPLTTKYQLSVFGKKSRPNEVTK